MILVVSLNPALDVTLHVPGVDWAGVNRSAMAAGLVHGLVLGRPWRSGCGTRPRCTASAAAPVAGEFSHADYAEALAGVRVSRGEAE